LKPPGFFFFWVCLKASRVGPEILDKARYGLGSVDVELNAIYSSKARACRVSTTNLRCKPGDFVKTDCRHSISWIRDRDFNAICKMGHGNFNRRVVIDKIAERLFTCGNGRDLELRDGVVFESRRVGEIAGGSARSGREARVGVNFEANRFGFSWHWN
jgi:hypothetical protein